MVNCAVNSDTYLTVAKSSDKRTAHRCVVCEAPGDFPYDARFDGPACDGCHAMLTIRDDIFRRMHPEHEEMIQAIWRDLRDPARAPDVGRRYAEIGYFEAFENEEPAMPLGPDDRDRHTEPEAVEDDEE